MAFYAFADACRAVARPLLTAGPPAMQQSIDIFWLPGPQQQTRSSGVRRPDGTDRRTDGRSTVAQTLIRILCGQCPPQKKIEGTHFGASAPGAKNPSYAPGCCCCCCCCSYSWVVACALNCCISLQTRRSVEVMSLAQCLSQQRNTWQANRSPSGPGDTYAK